MAAKSRRRDFALATVKEEPLRRMFEREPYSFGFFQAIRVLERMQPGREPLGAFTNPRKEVARLGCYASMSFPASYIQAARWTDDAQPFLVVNFFGLTGTMGVLPHFYTVTLMDRLRAKDTTLKDFLGLFNHRPNKELAPTRPIIVGRDSQKSLVVFVAVRLQKGADVEIRA